MKFHVSCAPYFAEFDPISGRYCGKSHASYALVNDLGYAEAIVDYELGVPFREGFTARFTEAEKSDFRAQCAKHFAETPRWNDKAKGTTQ